MFGGMQGSAYGSRPVLCSTSLELYILERISRALEGKCCAPALLRSPLAGPRATWIADCRRAHAGTCGKILWYMPEVGRTCGYMLASTSSTDTPTPQERRVVTQQLQIVWIILKKLPETLGIEQLLPNLHRACGSHYGLRNAPRHVVGAISERLH